MYIRKCLFVSTLSFAAPLDKVRTILQEYAAKHGDEKDCPPLFTQMAELVAMAKRDGQVRSHVWRQTAR